MQVINLTADSKVYTSNVFLIRTNWNNKYETNTLVDVGKDPEIIKLIDKINTPIGRKKIDQVILTHSHNDHTAILPLIKEKYNPVVYGIIANLKVLIVF